LGIEISRVELCVDLRGILANQRFDPSLRRFAIQKMVCLFRQGVAIQFELAKQFFQSGFVRFGERQEGIVEPKREALNRSASKFEPAK
jgi:hypothetical protein